MLDFVWISDRDLINTFQNWTASSVAWRRSQRFASSVTRTAGPRIGRVGPYATKVTTNEITVAARFNGTFEDNQESTVAVDEEQAPSNPGLVQLDVEKSAITVPTTTSITSAHVLPSRRQRKALDHAQYLQFSRRLVSARSPDAVRDFILEEKSSTRSQDLRKYSSTIFMHLVDLGTDSDAILALLKDQAINPLNHNNLGKIMIALERRVDSLQAYYALLNLAKQAITLGLATTQDLSVVLRSLPRVIRSVVTSDELRHVTLLTSRTLWAAIRSSCYMSHTFLNSNLISQMISMTVEVYFWEDLESALPEVMALMPVHQLEELETAISGAIVRSLLREDESAIIGAQRPAAEYKPITWIVRVLNQVPAHVARFCVASTTKALRDVSRRLRPDRLPQSVVYPWVASVAQCASVKSSSYSTREWASVEDLLARPWQPAWLVPYLSTMADKDASDFFFRYCIYNRLRRLVKSDLVDGDVLVAVTRRFKALQSRRPLHLTFSNLLDVVQEHTICQKLVLTQLNELLRYLNRPYEIYRVYLFLINSRRSIDRSILHKTLRDLAQLNGEIAIRLFRKQLRHQPAVALDECRDFIRTLIHDPSVKPASIMDLFCGPLESAYMNRWTRNQRRQRRQSAIESPARNELGPRVRLLHETALEFAHAQHLPDRAAFRFVHICYLHVRLSRHRIGHKLTRALTHAAITRPLRAGRLVSISLLQFVLERVKMVEGQEVAKRIERLVSDWMRFNKKKQRRRSAGRA